MWIVHHGMANGAERPENVPLQHILKVLQMILWSTDGIFQCIGLTPVNRHGMWSQPAAYLWLKAVDVADASPGWCWWGWHTVHDRVEVCAVDNTLVRVLHADRAQSLQCLVLRSTSSCHQPITSQRCRLLVLGREPMTAIEWYIFGLNFVCSNVQQCCVSLRFTCTMCTCKCVQVQQEAQLLLREQRISMVRLFHQNSTLQQ